MSVDDVAQLTRGVLKARKIQLNKMKMMTQNFSNMRYLIIFIGILFFFFLYYLLHILWGMSYTELLDILKNELKPYWL